jgi:hypothetical protein
MYSTEQLWQTKNTKPLTLLDLYWNYISAVNYKTFEVEKNTLQYHIFLCFWFLHIPEPIKAKSSICLVWEQCWPHNL